MDDETTVAARIERAEQQTMEAHIASENPLVVEVDNVDHGTTHAVVVDVPYCSCEDHQYRKTVCKHQIWLLLHGPAHCADRIRQSLADRVLDLDDARVGLERELSQIDSELSQIRSVFEAEQDQPDRVEDDGDAEDAGDLRETVLDDLL